MKTEDKNKNGTPLPMKSYILMVLAGGYLLYTAYQLCMPAIQGNPESGIGFLLAGLAFAVIGGGMLFYGIKGAVREDKRQKEEAQQITENTAEDTTSEE